MRAVKMLQNWSIGKKTMASHLLIASLSIIIATMLCYVFGYQYTRTNAIEELERQVKVIAENESDFSIDDRASRSYVVEMYQRLTNAAVFFVNRDGEALLMQRYVPPGTLPVAPSETQEDPIEQSEYSTVELFDTIDRQFVDRILEGETVTTVRRFVFADGVIIFSGAPILDEYDNEVGCVILSQPVEIMRNISRGLGFSLFIAACIAVSLAILLAIGQTHMLVRPILKMTRVARNMADGDYDHRIAIASNDEIGELGRTLNTLSLRLVETIETLREERDRLELVIGSIEEGILAVDRKMQIVHFNASFLAMMELDGIKDLSTSNREDVAQLLDALGQTLESREGSKISLINPSGRALLAEISALSAEETDQIGAVCLLADVSEAQRMEQLRRDYVANISHELRTPLTGIRGMIEPLVDGYVDTEEERQSCYAIIQKETIRLEKLVGEMLDMSRLQDGRIVVELEPMELPGILQSAIKSMSTLARDAGIELKLETDNSTLACMGNENRIVQVLVILLDNALDFTPRGGTVTVFARNASRRQVVVGVRDTGCGIEPRDLPLIWERFYKADRSRMRTKGTGLGLSIAKLVVELMGGEISVRSEPGHGSEFSFTLNKPKPKDVSQK